MWSTNIWKIKNLSYKCYKKSRLKQYGIFPQSLTKLKEKNPNNKTDCDYELNVLPSDLSKPPFGLVHPWPHLDSDDLGFLKM